MNDEEAQLSNHRLPSPYTKRSRWQVGKLCTPTISCTLSPWNKEYAAASACSMNNLQKGVPCQSKQNPSASPDSEHYGIGVSENSKTHLPVAARAAHGGGRGRSGNPAHRQYRKAPFGRASALPKTAPALAPQMERLLWWSWSRFRKCLAKQLHMLD